MNKLYNLIVLKIASIFLQVLRMFFGDGIFRNKLE